MASPNVGQLLDLLASVPAQAHENALSYVMSEWTMHQGELAQFTMLLMYLYCSSSLV
jgi:hypothetical protein